VTLAPGQGGGERPLDEPGRDLARDPEPERRSGGAGRDLPGEVRLALQQPREAGADQVVERRPQQQRVLCLDLRRHADRHEPRPVGEAVLAQPDECDPSDDHDKHDGRDLRQRVPEFRERVARGAERAVERGRGVAQEALDRR
jgi:hypothetical protein